MSSEQDTALADMLDDALVRRSEDQWKTIAFVNRHEIAAALRGPTWQPIDTAPRDGTLFDVRFGGIRYTDCFFDADGLLVRRHNYPSIRTVFMRAETAEWMPRPPGLIQPYDTDDNGRQYIP